MQFGKGQGSDNFNYKASEERKGWVSIDGAHSTKIYIGTATKPKKETYGQYAALLNAIEHSGTYYGFPTVKGMQDLKAKLPPGFKVTPKLHQNITHVKRLRNIESELAEFQEVVSTLGDNLGALLLLPHPGITPADIGTLMKFLDQLHLPAALELRHEDWFRDGYNMELFQYLVEKGIGTIIADTPGRRDAVHMHLTTPNAFIRFSCTGHEDIDQARIDAWHKRLSDWMAAGLDSLYFYVHADNEELARSLAIGLKLRFSNTN